MNNKITKEEKIKDLIDLFKQSDEDYVDCVFKFLCEEDFTYVAKIIGDDDWEAFKFMIWNGDKNE